MHLGKVSSSFYLELFAFASLLAHTILSEQNKLSVRILMKIEEFMEHASGSSKKAITYLLLGEVLYMIDNDTKHKRALVSMLGSYTKASCKKFISFTELE